jgi:uncharacterized protein (TIGR00369 family)
MSVVSQIQSAFRADLDKPGNVIRDAWDRLQKLPGGSRLFSRFVGHAAPYTGSIGAHVVELRHGYAKVTMRDRRAVRQHLQCVHAIALANLAELCGNVAIAYSLPADARFIVAGLTMEYLKKARGTITAEARPPVVQSSAKTEYPVIVEMRDPSGELVARCTLRTLIGPKRASGRPS